MLLIAIGLFTVFGICYTPFDFIRVAKWPYTEGKLIKAEVTYFCSNYQPEVEYSYEVDGKSYNGKRLSRLMAYGMNEAAYERQLEGIEYITENTVRVYYDPKKPKKSYLISKPFKGFFNPFRNFFTSIIKT